jgi:small subunit ribosomal protein S6
MRRYETFVIIDPDISQEERDPVVERVKELIAQMDGFLVFEEVWGDRKLAYEIRKKTRGYYVRFDYCGSVPLVNEIERFFRIDDRALKYMTVVLDKDVDLEKAKEEKAAAESKRESDIAASEMPQPAESIKPEPEAAAVEKAEEEPHTEEEQAGEEQTEEELDTSDTTESAEETTPSEKKEEV